MSEASDSDKKARAAEMVAEAMKLVEEKKKQGWTKEDFAQALKEMLESDNP